MIGVKILQSTKDSKQLMIGNLDLFLYKYAKTDVTVFHWDLFSKTLFDKIRALFARNYILLGIIFQAKRSYISRYIAYIYHFFSRYNIALFFKIPYITFTFPLILFRLIVVVFLWFLFHYIFVFVCNYKNEWPTFKMRV